MVVLSRYRFCHYRTALIYTYIWYYNHLIMYMYACKIIGSRMRSIRTYIFTYVHTYVYVSPMCMYVCVLCMYICIYVHSLYVHIMYVCCMCKYVCMDYVVYVHVHTT